MRKFLIRNKLRADKYYVIMDNRIFLIRFSIIILMFTVLNVSLLISVMVIRRDINRKYEKMEYRIRSLEYKLDHTHNDEGSSAFHAL